MEPRPLKLREDGDQSTVSREDLLIPALPDPGRMFAGYLEKTVPVRV
jgi:hypothetical protein